MVTGASGLVGSRFVDLYNNKCITLGINPSSQIKLNLLKEREIKKVILPSNAKTVLHFAAYTNVDKAQEQMNDKNGEVYILNTLAPKWLAQACQKSGKKLYHISTDYVFNGRKRSSSYKENDKPRPVKSWYAITKYEGENSVREVLDEKSYGIIRFSFPFSGVYKLKYDLARVLVDRLRENQVYTGITDQKIKPTFVDEIAKALNFLISKNAYGIYHVAGKHKRGFIYPYDFALKIAEKFGLNKSLIKPTNFSKYYKDKPSPRPKDTWLDTGKIESLGFKFERFGNLLGRFGQQYVGLG